MKPEVETLLNAIQSIKIADEKIQALSTQEQKSWNDIVMFELREKNFTQIEKIELRNIIEMLEGIERFINPKATE